MAYSSTNSYIQLQFCIIYHSYICSYSNRVGNYLFTSPVTYITCHCGPCLLLALIVIAYAPIDPDIQLHMLGPTRQFPRVQARLL